MQRKNLGVVTNYYALLHLILNPTIHVMLNLFQHLICWAGMPNQQFCIMSPTLVSLTCHPELVSGPVFLKDSEINSE